MKYVATWGQSAKQARLIYGIDNNTQTVEKVEQAMLMASEIQKSVMELATLEDTALLKSLGILEDNSSEYELDESESEIDYVESDMEHNENGPRSNASPGNTTNKDTSKTPPYEIMISCLKASNLDWFLFHSEIQLCVRQLCEDEFDKLLTAFVNNLSKFGLNEEELVRAKDSYEEFAAYQRRQPLMIEGDPSEESDSEGVEAHEGEFTQWCENGKKRIEALRQSIKQNAKRKVAKEIANLSVLKRTIPKRASRIVKEHPIIGKDMGDFVKSKRVGADAWRCTGVLTFDGACCRGKKVTHRSIQHHLEEKYSCKISHGTVVQLCVIRSK